MILCGCIFKHSIYFFLMSLLDHFLRMVIMKKKIKTLDSTAAIRLWLGDRTAAIPTSGEGARNSLPLSHSRFVIGNKEPTQFRRLLNQHPSITLNMHIYSIYRLG